MRSAHQDPTGSYYRTQLVPNKGYCWLAHADEVFPALGQKREGRPPLLIVNRGSTKSRRYEPLQDSPTLYREFASLAFTDEAILEFANKYGWLGVAETFFTPRNMPELVPGLPPATFVHGEGRNIWHNEISEMDFLVRLWDLKSAGSVEQLSKFLTWDFDRGAVRLEGGMANKRLVDSSDPMVIRRIEAPSVVEDLPVKLFGSLIADATAVNPHLYEQWVPGDPVGPITLHVANRVNDRLGDHVSPRLLLNPSNQALGYVVPRNLLGAMWLEFYLDIIGKLNVRRCAVCGEDMEVSEARSTKTMHDRCARREQMKRYYKKRKANEKAARKRKS